MKKRIFSDEKIIELHKKGYSDVKISNILKCCRASIRFRRYKLVLTANYTAWHGKKLTEEEIKKRRREGIEQRKKYCKTPKMKKWKIEYQRKQRKNNPERYRKYYKDYYYRKKEKLLRF